MLLELFIACNIRYVFLSFDSIKTIIIIIIIHGQCYVEVDFHLSVIFTCVILTLNKGNVRNVAINVIFKPDHAHLLCLRSLSILLTNFVYFIYIRKCLLAYVSKLCYPKNQKMCNPIIVNPVMKILAHPAAHPH